MEERARTLKHLKVFRALIEEKIHTEVMFREHLKKKKPTDLGMLLADSMSYQRFLEDMVTEVVSVVIDDISL